MQCCPLCICTALQSLGDHTLLFLQDLCLLQLAGLMGSSKGCKTNGKSLVNLCLIRYQVLSAASAGQIWIYTHVTEIAEFCKQDGWCAGSRQIQGGCGLFGWMSGLFTMSSVARYKHLTICLTDWAMLASPDQGKCNRCKVVINKCQGKGCGQHTKRTPRPSAP